MMKRIALPLVATLAGVSACSMGPKQPQATAADSAQSLTTQQAADMVREFVDTPQSATMAVSRDESQDSTYWLQRRFWPDGVIDERPGQTIIDCHR